jgi:hypothetical protein
VLPVFRAGKAPPRVVILIVLDGMRRDYFDRYATLMPTLTALRQRGAWFTQAQLSILPSNTAVGHSTIATGTDPAIHGVTGVNVYDHIGHVRHEMFAGAEPGDLMALTLADVWQFATSGRAIILAQGSKPENLQIFIDEERMLKLGLTLPDLARFLRSQPFLFCAFTSDEVRLAAARL